MELFQMKCFVAVAEELHFGRAAARLFMTQPPLSRQIQLLEDAVGVTLLERTSRSVHLTAAGKSFYRDARALLAQAEAAAANARRVSGGEAGQVVLGYTAVAGYALIPELIAAAQKRFADIDIVLREMVSADQLDALASHAIDLALVRPLGVETAFSYELAVREPLLLALPDRHPLAAKARIQLKNTADQPFIMYAAKEGKYFYDRIVNLYAASGISPRYVQHIAQTHTILALVRAGIGMAIVPASAQRLGFEKVTFRPLWRRDMFAEFYLAWHPAHRNPALDVVRRFAGEYLRGPGKAQHMTGAKI
nr:LysR family transcriptional regulator [Noviherbaspirillum humi]